MGRNSRNVIFLGVIAPAMMIGATGCERHNAHPPNSTSSPLNDASAEQAKSDEAAALAAAVPIDPKLIAYRQSAAISTDLREMRALAVDADDRIYVGGDKLICRYSPEGILQRRIPLLAEPKCLAIGGKGRNAPDIFVGMEDHVEVIRSEADGNERIENWISLGDKASLTSIVTAEDEVFVADAGNRIVWKYDHSGNITGRIGAADPARHVPGFLITNRFFDAALGTDGLLYVVNPRALRIEGYTRQGDLEVHWGTGSPAVEDFFGCCNPAQLAVLPDGRFVTAEKGIPRVKVYSREGKFQDVVAGPGQLSGVPADLATDSRSRILILDSSAASVRIFVPKSETAGANR